MRHLDHVANLLFSEDPRAKAGRLLDALIAEADARSGAVLSVRQGALQLFATSNVPLSVLAAVEARWPAVKDHLRAGLRVEEASVVLLPLQNRDDLAGLIVLEAPRTVDLEEADMLHGLLSRAVSGPAVGGPASTSAPEGGEVPAHESQKARLLELLQRNEWNVALVARKLAVTRRTVYLRMERYGIERRRVPKTLKRVALVV